jgi:peptidoglycan hydrolase-like amidase
MAALTLALTIHIGVFGLFHPKELEVKPVPGQVLIVESGGVTQTLESGRSIRLRSTAHVTGRGGAPATFVLSVPGKIRREYSGTLAVAARNGELMPVVEMDRETAVASIVAAELAASAPLEAMKAQAVAVRSFLAAARNRHEGFEFCDTTHCQFLREAPGRGSNAARAAEATRGVVLVHEGRVVAALYSANCGGHTRSLAEAGWGAGAGTEEYPYFGVACPRGGVVAGHQIGLCQSGAAEMARRGVGFREILAHFYPATGVMTP